MKNKVTIIISEDQNTITVKGIEFVFVQTGCYTCDLKKICINQQMPCIDSLRIDGRYGLFKRKT